MIKILQVLLLALLIIVVTIAAFVLNGGGEGCTPAAIKERCAPRLITQAEGVKVFRACKSESCYSDYLYFTTKGETSWDTRHQSGKTSFVEHEGIQ